MEMEVGMTFIDEGGEQSGSAKMSKSYSNMESQTAQSSIAVDVSVDQTITCTSEPTNPGVALWQYITWSYDSKMKVQGSYTTCRYGSEINDAPKCPPSACKTAGCYECESDWSV